MMNFQDWIDKFDQSRESITEMVKYSAICVDCPDADNCRLIEQVLRKLGERGNAYAAALYIAVTVYDNHENTFSKETAMILYEKEGVKDEYESVVEELFEGILNEADYVRFRHFFEYYLFEILNGLLSDSSDNE